MPTLEAACTSRLPPIARTSRAERPTMQRVCKANKTNPWLGCPHSRHACTSRPPPIAQIGRAERANSCDLNARCRHQPSPTHALFNSLTHPPTHSHLCHVNVFIPAFVSLLCASCKSACQSLRSTGGVATFEGTPLLGSQRARDASCSQMIQSGLSTLCLRLSRLQKGECPWSKSSSFRNAFFATN